MSCDSCNWNVGEFVNRKKKAIPEKILQFAP